MEYVQHAAHVAELKRKLGGKEHDRYRLRGAPCWLSQLIIATIAVIGDERTKCVSFDSALHIMKNDRFRNRSRRMTESLEMVLRRRTIRPQVDD
jgi:hypothetical protein